MTTQERKASLQSLVDEYIRFKEEGKLDITSEETIRTWLNAMLVIFGWDVRDTSQVLQEKVLSKMEKERLKAIGSTNIRPDYTFKIAKQKLAFLDAKDISVDIYSDSEVAFQIKSYGWSISAPCSFISNFEQFAIYDCTYIPSRDQLPTFGRTFLSIDEYVDNYEILENHLLKDNIYKGKLNELYSATYLSGVTRTTPDFAFAELLSSFRLQLATEIFQQNHSFIGNNSDILSYIVQIIINRVLFIRVCEARKIEEEGLLLSFKAEGFWKKFNESSYFDFYEHYDGPLFDRIESIHNLNISDAIFNDLLQFLYYPSPYRFDVIPTKLLSDIYEIFLSRKLKIQDGQVLDELKSEYLKTKGAVSTPQYIVTDVIRQTLRNSDFQSGNIEDLLHTSVLDIACGSGVFAIEAYDYLEEMLKLLYKNNREELYKNLFWEIGEEIILNLAGKKMILDNCIFGVDIDPEAVEVAKMSLALKVLDNADYPEGSEVIGLFGDKILDGIGNNIRCGNTLVDSTILDSYPALLGSEEELIKTNIFDWDSVEGFSRIFEEKGGFDYIISNPPYVEVKNYNVELPVMHQFIKARFPSSKNGKVDLAIPFIERALSLLNENGRLGFIVQKRFFKTDYGMKIREIISDQHLISCIIDFTSTEIFKDHITYVSILVLDKSAPDQFYYKLFPQPVETLPFDLPLSNIPEIDSSGYQVIPASSMSKAPWSFDDPFLISLRTRLSENGTLGDSINIKVGIQALWDRAYHIRPMSIQDDILTGGTHLEASFQIELGACRPLICNERFYPYRSDSANIYVIFPYDVEAGEVSKILFSDFVERFPLAAAYLNRNKAAIKKAVETLPKKFPDKYNDEYWHLFTREQNHGATYPKIPIPMTSMDTFAFVSKSDMTYCDNANVNFIELVDKSDVNLYAMSGIINSIVFSVFARSFANPQTSGYFKFNKQFLEPIPFPVENFANNDQLKAGIAQIARNIEQRQNNYLLGSPTQQRAIGKILLRLWGRLDERVYELYGFSDEERIFFNQRGRNLNRIELLNH